MEQFIPKKQEKEVISIRIHCDMLAEVDNLAAKIKISRNELINQCIEFAMQHIDETIKQ
ncbi:MAG: ribbon-helix-helix protein, CopG family [Candidatus Ornithomonoglobus sp.]